MAPLERGGSIKIHVPLTTHQKNSVTISPLERGGSKKFDYMEVKDYE